MVWYNKTIRCYIYMRKRESTCFTNGCSAHWGRVTHIFVGDLTTIGSDSGSSLGRHQAIISTNAGILLIGP